MAVHNALPLLAGALIVAATSGAACRRGAAPPPGAGGPPASAVKIVTLTPVSIEDTSDFIATLHSLHSTTIRPDAEGLITKIFVASGDQVKVGTPLLQINAEKQQAAVTSTEANRATIEADLAYWTVQVKRLAALVEAGAISRAEFDQAQTSLRNAQARLEAVNAQVRQGRVELQFYRVTAPQNGIVGDIPVRVGDRVTTSTIITTIDDRNALEAYVQVPLDRSPDLKLGLTVQLLDSDGKVTSTNKITFVASRVDDETQSVLVKSELKAMPTSVRVQQFVRARIIWRTVEGLTVPITAVVRVSGQYFCFVAEPGQNGTTVARQKPIDVGNVLGNDYVLKSGLKPGEKLIVSGIQKIGDGAPVRAE
jgi:RND family efflux transporter MFP subunit